MALMFFEKLLADPEALKPIFHKDFTFTYMGKIPDTLVPYGVPYDSESLFTEWLAHIPKVLPFGIELKTTDIIADENGVAVRQKGEAKGKYGQYNNDYSWLFKFKDGKILSIEEFNSDFLVAKSLYGRGLAPSSPQLQLVSPHTLPELQYASCNSSLSYAPQCCEIVAIPSPRD